MVDERRANLEREICRLASHLSRLTGMDPKEALDELTAVIRRVLEPGREAMAAARELGIELNPDQREDQTRS